GIIHECSAANEPNQGADDLVELSKELSIQPADVAQRLSHLETRERLARRPKRSVIPRIATLSASVHPLRNVQSYACPATSELPIQIGIAPRNLSNRPPELFERFENHRINTQHDHFSSASGNHAEGAYPAVAARRLDQGCERAKRAKHRGAA